MSDIPPTGDPGLSVVVDAIGELVDRRGFDDRARVVVVTGRAPAELDRVAARLAKEHEAPVFRLAPEDLVAPPPTRIAAVLRLLDAAEVAGAVAMVDAADAVAPDRAAEVGLAQRLATHRGVVVLVGDVGDRSPLADVVEDLVPPT